MDYRTFFIVLLICLLVCALGAAGYFYLQAQNSIGPIPIPEAITTPKPEDLTPKNSIEIDLYFLTPDHTQLAIEKRLILQPTTLPERIEEAITRLIDGPHELNMLPVIPEGTKLESVFWSQPDGMVYVNFSKEILDHNRDHVLAEWATIYSIVNTVAAQSATIKSVQILVGGEIVPNTSTVWDWSLPFQPNNTFVLYDTN